MTEGAGLKTLAERIAQQFDPTVTWKDFAWLRQQWAAYEARAREGHA